MLQRERALFAIAVALVTVVAVVAGGTVLPASAQTGNESTTAEEPAESTTITVSASGQASGQPSEAVIRIESAATADSPADAAERLAENTSQLRDALAEAGIDSENLQTIYYSIDGIRDDSDLPGPRPEQATSENTTYRARQGFEIEVDNTSRLGELIDVAVANGATAVRGVEFQLSEENRSELRQQALEQAMGDARVQAETLAGTESLSITGVESISSGQPFFGAARALETSDAAGGGATMVESGPVTVEVTVTVIYEAEER